MKEYEKFLGEECIQFKDEFEAFNQDKDRLNEFLGYFYEEKSNTKASEKICVITTMTQTFFTRAEQCGEGVQC